MLAADGGPPPSLVASPLALSSAARMPGPITAGTATTNPRRPMTTRPPTTATPHPGPITAARAGKTAIAIGCADDHGFLPADRGTWAGDSLGIAGLFCLRSHRKPAQDRP